MKLSIINSPFNLGLKQLQPSREPGVNKLPEWLREHNFHNSLAPQEIHTLESPAYRMDIDPESSILNTESIVDYAKKQADLLSKVISEKNFPLIIGGDCSIAIGAALALKQEGNYALFYLDGHTDFIPPELSETKAVAGMVAAIIAGIGQEKLTNINNQKPYIKEEYVWCVGNREYDDEYEDAIRFSNATYVSLAELRKKGIANTINAFLKMVNNQKLDGFWLHIDVDVLADELMPAVDSRTPGGLRYEEFNQVVKQLLSDPKITGLDITILDPDLDPTSQYTTDFVLNFTNTFNATQNQKVK